MVRGGLKMKYVPLGKMNKRAQKEYYEKQRGTWDGLSPVSRVIPSKRGYDRNRVRTADRDLRAMEG